MDVVVVPGVAAGDAIRSMGVPAARILEGFNAVDVSSFAAASARVVSPTHAGHAFAYVGQLIERKNVAGMIRAFSKARGVHDTLTIVGSGDQLPMLKDLTLALGLEERVRFVGQVANEELPSVLVTVDTLILPSLEEVWGLVVNEALASGCQVIVSERAGVAPSVQGMRGVYIVSPTVDGIIKGIGLARSRYIGRVPKPEILRHSPEAFASVFQKAICD
ncbi:glycosyltransferase [Microbacterium testaceum]|uniref:glycosyltransferase n=1 Tax=Microbacterium testaceum TaxID=2033 RepID=UPI001D17CB16|nr:glycosyltransferase [Microbacterium testaceum]MCC4249430.1 glycosyltransferase [Microbacterium testaceum]